MNVLSESSICLICVLFFQFFFHRGRGYLWTKSGQILECHSYHLPPGNSVGGQKLDKHWTSGSVFSPNPFHIMIRQSLDKVQTNWWWRQNLDNVWTRQIFDKLWTGPFNHHIGQNSDKNWTRTKSRQITGSDKYRTKYKQGNGPWPKESLRAFNLSITFSKHFKCTHPWS